MRLKLKTCPEDCSPPKHAGADLLQCRGNSWTVHHLLCLASSMQLHLARVALLTLGSLQGASAPRPPVAPAPALQWKAAYPQSHGATPAQRQWCVQAHLLQQRVLACQLLPPRLLLLTLDCCLHSACHWQKPCGPLARSHHVLPHQVPALPCELSLAAQHICGAAAVRTQSGLRAEQAGCQQALT